MSAKTFIELKGVRTHNLKNLDLRIPHHALTVVTGISGSGKSSLAFATLYAEGQRRFLESISTYSRQYFKSALKPEVDAVRGIPPAIAFEQKNVVRNARSTVGTASEINDYLKLLYSTLGHLHCPRCQTAVVHPNASQSALQVSQCAGDTPLWLLLVFDGLDPQNHEQAAQKLIELGYRHGFKNGERVELKACLPDKEPLCAVLDRLTPGHIRRSRVLEAFENGLTAGRHVLLTLGPTRYHIEVWQGQTCLNKVFDAPSCPNCLQRFALPEPAWFSFNSALGACPACEGYGRIIDIDMEKAVNQNSALAFGAVAPFQHAAYADYLAALLALCHHHRISTHLPYRALAENQRKLIEDGSPADDWPGIRGFFKQLEKQRYKVHVRVFLARYRAYLPCPHCQGQRLNPLALQVKLAGRSIADLWQLPLPELKLFLNTLPLDPTDKAKAGTVWKEVCRRVDLLCQMGLTYLNLARPTRTLSGGEYQRLRIAHTLGNALTQSLYVLDEPTIGLHACDVERMVTLVKQLVTGGNTVVVVEHASQVIAAADHIIELGPGAGESGGHLVAEGRLRDLPAHSRSRAALSGKSLLRPAQFRSPCKEFIEVRNARANNLKNLTFRIPLNRLVCLSGISGSGKTTLMKHVLYGQAQYLKGNTEVDRGPCDAILGLEQVDEVMLIDQSPVSPSPRSNPATLTGAYGILRALLAATPAAKERQLGPGHFSFNSGKGRCPACEGRGAIIYDMQFLDDLTLCCDTCQGKRFTSQTLAVRYRGKNVADMLHLTASEACQFFSDQPKILRALEPLVQVGLAYLRLGQATSTLSGGESQRLKLATVLGQSRSKARYLLLFDEPTTGLHHDDIATLFNVLHELLMRGHSLLVVEHHLDFLLQCDYLIDLGPAGGSKGGHIVDQGALSKILKTGKGITAQYLRERFNILMKCPAST